MRLLCVNWAGIMTLSMACTTPLSATMSHEVTSDLGEERKVRNVLELNQLSESSQVNLST